MSVRRISMATAVLVSVASVATAGRSGQQPLLSELVEEFRAAALFWQQAEVGRKIVSLGRRDGLERLEPWLAHEDRHIRGNVAFIFAALGDPRGLATIIAILGDRGDRQEGQGSRTFGWTLARQIETDRYYAVHLLGELKDARAVSVLVPLLADADVNYNVAWALGEIGDVRAVQPLIAALADPKPLMRVSAIHGLEKLRAREALPHLRALLSDNEFPSAGDQVPVAAAARAAIRALEKR